MLEAMYRRGLSARVAGVAAGMLALLLVGASSPNDPLLDRQYHVRRVRAPEAWEERRAGWSEVIAVLDTGVDLEHPDLKGRLVAGIDLVDRGSPPDDDNGHGTFVAGVAAATLNNDEGGTGIAPASKIMPVRVLNKEGRGTSDIVAEGIRWATREGANVINLSLADVPGQERAATDLITTDVELAIRQAALDGVVVVCAAGNEGEKETPYSDDLPALIVGASGKRDGLWEHSNYDDDTLFAPGVDIVSTYIGDPYAVADGTSFAAPVVSAAAAMVLQDGLDEQQTRRRLKDTARPIGYGTGRVDIAAALGIAPRVRSTPKPEPEPKREPSDERTERRREEPEPLGQPSPIKPRREKRTPETQEPSPLPTLDTKPRKDDPPKVAQGGKPKKKRQPPAAAAGTPTMAPGGVIAAPSEMPPGAGQFPWPFAVAGVLLFVVLVGIGGYLAAKNSGG